MIRLSTLFLAFSLLLMSCRGKTEKEPVSETAEADTETTAQTEDAEIFPVSHATAVLRWGPTTIYIDPVGGADVDTLSHAAGGIRHPVAAISRGHLQPDRRP